MGVVMSHLESVAGGDSRRRSKANFRRLFVGPHACVFRMAKSKRPHLWMDGAHDAAFGIEVHALNPRGDGVVYVRITAELCVRHGATAPVGYRHRSALAACAASIARPIRRPRSTGGTPCGAE